MLAFGITPGLSVALGGLCTTHFGWQSCFYTSAMYGVILLLLATRLPETKTVLDKNAIKLTHLMDGYSLQFKNPVLLMGGFLMGVCTCFIYVFAAIGPFIAINLLGINSAQYGIANILPPIGLIIGSLCAGYLAKRYLSTLIIRLGIAITCVGTLFLLIAVELHLSVIPALFLPLIIIYFGLSLILPNASSLAMSSTPDKAHGSAVMSFINMGTATLIVLNLGFFTISKMMLPGIYLVACLLLTGLYQLIVTHQQKAITQKSA